MIKSMTGYGRCEISDDKKKISVEIKSVNHRYLDLNIRMPKKFNQFENEIRNIVKGYAIRGKIDMYINYENLSEEASNLKFNAELAGQYLNYYREISERFGIVNNINASILANCNEVLTMEDDGDNGEELWEVLKPVVIKAVENFVETRLCEGMHLAEDLEKKLDVLAENVEFISIRSPKVLTEYRQKLMDKVSEVLNDAQIDENRIATEVVIYSDKMCVDEEIVRLKSHIEKMRKDLKSNGDIGKKLDFLAQEMNREANTIMSKSNDLEVTDKGIELKIDIEKIREQIQNIE